MDFIPHKFVYLGMRIFISLTIFLLIAFICNAQQASKIKPVQVVWVADGDTLDIEQAQRGIVLPEKLQIAVILDQKTIGKMNGEQFEFKWFMKGTNKSIITNSFFEQVNSSAPGHLAYTISTGRGSLRKGWWKVQIIAYADKNLISFNNKMEFWINLK